MTKADTPQLSPREWFKDLVGLFPTEEMVGSDFDVIAEGDVPPSYAGLLVHDSHMTRALEKTYGSAVNLHVLEVFKADPFYARRLYLSVGDGETSSGSRDAAVLAGIMRINLNVCHTDVRNLIVDANTPLGRVLLENNVLTRVQTVAYLKLAQNTTLASLFQSTDTAAPAYGRLAMIFCDGEPAVELLEIVSPQTPPDRSKKE